MTESLLLPLPKCPGAPRDVCGCRCQLTDVRPAYVMVCPRRVFSTCQEICRGHREEQSSSSDSDNSHCSPDNCKFFHSHQIYGRLSRKRPDNCLPASFGRISGNLSRFFCNSWQLQILYPYRTSPALISDIRSESPNGTAVQEIGRAHV